MTLADVESQIFYEIEENVSSLKEWTAEELRAALSDAIDEMAIHLELFKYEVGIPLLQNVGIYTITIEGASPFYIKRAKLWEQDRKLIPESILGLMMKDRKFLVSRGSPFCYVPLATDLVMVYPIPAESGDLLKLDIMGAPDHYDIYNQYPRIREELETALVHYGKYFLLLREAGGMVPALEAFGEYLKILGMGEAFKHNQRIIYKARLGK